MGTPKIYRTAVTDTAIKKRLLYLTIVTGVTGIIFPSINLLLVARAVS